MAKSITRRGGTQGQSPVSRRPLQPNPLTGSNPMPTSPTLRRPFTNQKQIVPTRYLRDALGYEEDNGYTSESGF